MSGDNLKISQGQNMTTCDVDQICGQHKIFKVCSCHKPCGIFTKAAAYELQKKLDKKSSDILYSSITAHQIQQQ